MIKIKKAIKLLLGFPNILWLSFITYLPGEIGFILRWYYWKRRLIFLGNKARIDTGVYFQNPEFITISENSWIDKNVTILAGFSKPGRDKITLENTFFKGNAGEIFIGRNCHIGIGTIISGISGGCFISDNCTISAHCHIYALIHHYRSFKNPSDQSIIFGSMGAWENQCVIEGAIVLEENTGVALNVTILPGVAIGKNSFVFINSVVNKGVFAENSILSGDPAVVINTRFK